jgi:cation transport regulator
MPRKPSSSMRRRTTTRRGKSSSRRSRTTPTTSRRSSSSSSSSRLSARTRKAIDTLPSHAQEIYKKAHKSALKQYKSPSKRRGGKQQSREQVAHKVAWSAVKKEYKKKGDKWVPKD